MKFLFCLLRTPVALLLCVLTCSVGAAAAPDLGVRSAVLVDVATRKVLYSQNADAAVPPASLTKIVSMYVTLDRVKAKKLSLQETVRVSKAAAGQGGSRMHLKPGERVKLDRLLMGMAVSSGNDASVAVAEHVAGSVARFVRLMNAKMRELGLKRSVFKNPHGLPAAGQQITAREMALLACSYLKKHPEALRYHKTRSIRHNGALTTNKNPLLGSCTGADGLKTGWTTASGYNVITTVKRGKTRLLGVVLGAPSGAARATEVRRLMEAGFEARRKGVSVASVLRKTPLRAEKAEARPAPSKARPAKAEARPASPKAASPKAASPKAAAGKKSAAAPAKTGARASASSRPAARASRPKAAAAARVGRPVVAEREAWTSSGSLAPVSEKKAPARARGASHS